MKTCRFLIFFFFFSCMISHTFSQITLEFENTKYIMGPVKLSHSGWKYVDYSDLQNNQIRLYNLDNTLFRNLILPPRIDGAAPLAAFYFSETLFDNDSTDIEYYLGYIINNTHYYTRIANERGEIILEEDGATTFEVFTTGKYYYSIYETDHGTKMQLYYFDQNGNYEKTKVFSLLGSYPGGIEKRDEKDFAIYPNPSDGFNTIKLNNQANLKNGFINIYDSRGTMVKKITIDSNVNEIKLDNSDLKAGVYLYEIFSNESFCISQKKVIIVN
jgi:hypothetical protein